MSLVRITALSLIEIVGDTFAKNFSNQGGIFNLGMGLLGYVGVFIFLVISLQGSTLLMVNGAWDGMSAITSSIFAYFILGERFESLSQYFGLVIIIFGMYLLKVPLFSDKPFTMPSL